ncbi:hypothetical protein KUTeg_007395 [Tegillarca granosa]|uniref:dolichyl-phosphate-mannose--protein mannosyltransferase n=1 Tax=Tegillarca granosa TaxID=220873 RepID=A0ABQ9FD55_TEGGR|nr:hypothetical protein KUTeg_007395 [Tegillarca granosa]
MLNIEVRAMMDGRGLLFVLGTAIFTTASMLTKEQGIMVIAVCASYDLFVYHKVKVTDIVLFRLNLYKKEGVLEGLLCLSAIGMFLIAIRFYFMGFKPPEFAPSDNPASDSDSLFTRTLTYLLLPVLNFWILVCPRVLSFDWSMDAIPLVESLFDYRNIFSLLFYSILTYSCYLLLNHIQNVKLKLTKTHVNGNGVSHYHNHHSNNQNSKDSIKYNFKISRQHSRRGSSSSTESDDHVDFSKHYKIFTSQDILIISIAIMVFPFILATNLFFYVGFVIAERILYIPSMGFSLLVAQGVWILYKKFILDSSKRKIIGVTFIVLLCLLSAKTVVRNRVWLTEENLYHSGITVNPAKAWGNYANVLNSQGKTAEAEQAYKNALKHRGNMADTHYNLTNGLNRPITVQNQWSQQAHNMAHLNLAILFAQLGRHKEAEKIYKHCANLDTSGLKDPRLHENTKISALYNLGRMYSEQDKNQEAIEVYKEALRRRPSYYAPQSIYNMLGEVYMKIGNLDLAEHWYNEALKSKPDHIPAHLTMAKLYQKKNQLVKAEEWFQKAKKIDPNDFLVDQHYGQFLGETGRLQESAEMYKTALRKKPEDFELCFNAANVFRQIQDNALAEQLYRKAAQLKPHVATAHMNLGAMLHFNGKLIEAEKSYLEALKLKPDDVTTQQNLQKLRNLIQSQQVKGGV